ncbi:MAG: hypothetical protein ACKO4T_03005 [Planctomycetaceae bacterium]
MTLHQPEFLPTTGSIASRLGPLELENGYPTDGTIAKVFDDIDVQRACQAYLWALPLMAMQQWQREQLSRRASRLPRPGGRRRFSSTPHGPER